MPEREAQPGMDRVGTLLREVGVAPTVERAKERSEELVRALVQMYGDGLERVLDIVHEAAAERSEIIFTALCNDRYVEGLLALHGLHPLALEDRVQAALDSIRPYLESHEGNVELTRVEDGIAYVRLAGSCDGCHASAATLKNAVENAIFERVAEIVDVRAEGIEPPVATAVHALKLHSDWIALADLPELETAGVAHIEVSGAALLLLRHEQRLYAYRDRCPACMRPLDGAFLEWPFVCCAGCGRRFDAVHAGRAADSAAPPAEPFPLIREGDRVRVAIPLGI
jgi:Fe-S cluster biogenesis protein NfuA/nitrite reductase/ring-hydroxylating ferredoxin subunit